jgi:carboxyl-terminal processing protease
MAWQIFEQHGAKHSPASLTSIDIAGQGLPRPSFDLGWILVDDPKRGRDIVGNGDGIAQVGERVRLQMTVRNSGAGAALDAFVSLRNFAGDAVFFDDGRLKLGKLGVGEIAGGELTLEIRKLPKDGKATVQINVVDSSIGESLSEKAVIPVSEEPLLVVPAKGWVTANAPTTLHASPMRDAPIVARAETGAVLASEAKIGSWTRVTLPDGKGAFIESSAVRSADGKGPGPGAAKSSAGITTVLAVSPPRVTVLGASGSTDAERIHLSGAAEDADGVRDMFITVVNPSRDLFMRRNKVFYQASPDPSAGRLEFSADVPLQPGNNLVEIHARQNEDVVAVHRMRVLRTSGLDEARSAARKSKSNGKLSVDTLGQ